MKVSRKVGRKSAIAVAFAMGASFFSLSRARGAELPYTVRMQALPKGSATAVLMDYIAFDPATGSVWAPAGNTAAVDVVDTSTGNVRQISGLPTAEVGAGDRKRVVGPSSVTIGEGKAYVGNRGDSTVCAFDSKSLAKGVCHRLDSSPDGIAYAAPTKEVWVTTPRDKSIRILDAATLEEKAKLTLDGNPEGFAVDVKRGRFYTNLEDKDRTVAIDLKTHATVATWKPACGEEGPRGLRVDAGSGHLFVACTALVKVLDAGHDGAILGSVETGEGVDDIDYSAQTHLLYVGAAKAGQLTIARAAADGKLSLVAAVPTRVGARNPAVTDKGSVYLAHSSLGGLTDLVVVDPKK